MLMHTVGELLSLRGQPNGKGATVQRGDLALDQTTVFESIENACQRRAFVGQPAMKVGHASLIRFRQECKDVRFALRQARFTQGIEIESDAMCGAMDGMNKLQ